MCSYYLKASTEKLPMMMSPLLLSSFFVPLVVNLFVSFCFVLSSRAIETSDDSTLGVAEIIRDINYICGLYDDLELLPSDFVESLEEIHNYDSSSEVPRIDAEQNTLIQYLYLEPIDSAVSFVEISVIQLGESEEESSHSVWYTYLELHRHENGTEENLEPLLRISDLVKAFPNNDMLNNQRSLGVPSPGQIKFRVSQSCSGLAANDSASSGVHSLYLFNRNTPHWTMGN